MTTNQTPDKNKNPCRSCKKLKRRVRVYEKLRLHAIAHRIPFLKCLGVYPIPCAYCVQQKKQCKYPEPKVRPSFMFEHPISILIVIFSGRWLRTIHTFRRKARPS